MKNRLILWLVNLVVAAILGSFAHIFEGACPWSAGSFFCHHWDFVVSIASLFFGAFGIEVKRRYSAKAANKAQLSVVPPEEDPPPPAEWSDNVSTGEPDDFTSKG